MHDPKLSEKEVQRFELEVQQKMEELEFSPSAAVWATIEKEIRVEKKRRVPFFWLFFLAGLLLTGGTGFYFLSSHSVTPSPSSGRQLIGNQPSDTPSPDGQPIGSRQPGGQPVSAQSSGDRSVTTPSPGSTSTGTPPSADQSIGVRSPEGRLIGNHSSVQEPNNTQYPGDQAAKADHRTHRPSAHFSGKRTTAPLAADAVSAGESLTTAASGTPEPSLIAGPSLAANKKTTAANKKTTAANKKTTAADLAETTASVPAETTAAPAAIHLNPINQKNIAAIQAAPLAKKTPPTTIRPTPQRAWEAGFTAGIGISALHQNLLKGSAVTANDARNLSAPMPVTGLTTTKNYVSKIRPDLSFWAGIFLKKPILNDVAVSVGLNLHYYSTKVYTGDKVINNASSYYYSPASSLLVNAAAPTPAQSYPYYTTGDNATFINRYYFLEIPGSIQWQISHSHTMPLFWEVGGTLSYLVSSNAIYYNTKAGVYYKDGNVSNKTQFNLSTALMVGIPFSGLQMQVGPQLQYAVTDLLNTQSASGQHLFYGGLKLVIIPGKSHKRSTRLFREP